MTLPSIAKLRIAILLALAIAEGIGFQHFYGQHGFTQFVVFSLEGIFIIALALWFQSLRQRGVPGSDIFIAMIAGAAAIVLSGNAYNFWIRGDNAVALGSAGVSIFIAMTILFKLLCPNLGPIAKDFLGFFGYVVMLAWVCSIHMSILWKVAAGLPLLWFVWRVAFHIRNKQGASSSV
jgi:hypothetical protein